ncbi:phage holin family protein [Nostocoides jenkinsii]|uniref:Integral membrane protein n=1 Tax=Nostocoides jenkinsii Ben 74 TaxID=1193518 RepID=A0A077MC38_9MICO|nr:phage holin family protein [Tetrasphaera jenkinsii]CCI53400.1 conserved hypothetical protein [Tetrasphaera jenkinsii Ben 74]
MASSPVQDERTVGQLVADASRDITALVNDHIALAKAEVTSGVKVAGKGAGMFAGAAFVGLLGLIFLFLTLGLVLDIWLPRSLSFGIVTLLLFLVAGVLALLGKKAISAAKPKPEKAITEAQKTVAAVKSAA